MTRRFRGYVALGDSFTEGMDDRLDDGSYRGWADLVAGRLAEFNPGMSYANLAIRGRRFDGIVDEQVPAALRLRPDLVSFAAGGNDVLRPGFQPPRIATRLHEVVRVLTASGAHVVLVTASTVNGRLPGNSWLRNRFVALNQIIHLVAARHDATVVDLWNEADFSDHRLWSEDRLHMSKLGHQQVAGLVCRDLAVDPDPAWKFDLDETAPTPWLRRRRDDLRWTRTHLTPWLKRRLTGASSGDGRSAKRPELGPVHDEGS